ncbi:CGNR zinc finger domain-containing protein [Azospirillum thermophilum]|nr:CGNR zinc finger domain-containing protein [Azospirillum thermophilum]
MDFLNTGAGSRGAAREWLSTGRDLLAWLDAAGLLAPEQLGVSLGDGAEELLDDVAHRARSLREWFRGFVQSHAGRPLTAADVRDLAPLNALLATDDAFRRIEAAGRPEDGRGHDHGEGAGVLRWRNRRRWRGPDVLLLPIADSIGDLLTGEDFTLVKQCEGEGCGLLFLDRTRAKSRRWCSMALCGNRAKVAAFRAKRRG